MRLVKDYTGNDYVFHARDWVTGDAGRISQNNISYDDASNTLTAKATGNNDVALLLDWEHHDYEINAAQQYLIVKGSNLSRASGASYLWWLNGINKSSQVAPTTTKQAVDGDVIIAWNMTASGLNGNNTGDRFSICKGKTIFGLTSTTGTSVIRHIGFYESIVDFEAATPVVAVAASSPRHSIYNLSGQRLPQLISGPQIIDGRTVYKR